MMIPWSKISNDVRACTIKHLNLEPAKHEEAAIYIVNQRIPNVCRIVRAAFAAEQFVDISKIKKGRNLKKCVH